MTGKYTKMAAVMQSSSTVSSCLSGYVNTLEPNGKARYVGKISLCDGVDLYTMQNPGFSTDYKDLPNVQFANISNYLVVQTSFYSKQQIKAYKKPSGV